MFHSISNSKQQTNQQLEQGDWTRPAHLLYGYTASLRRAQDFACHSPFPTRLHQAVIVVSGGSRTLRRIGTRKTYDLSRIGFTYILGPVVTWTRVQVLVSYLVSGLHRYPVYQVPGTCPIFYWLGGLSLFYRYTRDINLV